MAWTQARIETMRRGWDEGLSAAQIARELGGVTRNAVIGKLHRLGMSGRVYERKQRTTAPRRAVNTNRIKGARIAAQKPKAEPPQPIEPLNIPFLERRPYQCAAITDATRYAQRCCGHVIAGGSAYCAAHQHAYTIITQARTA